MAHALSITDGTTTVSLTGSGVFLTQYVPTAPTVRTTSLRGLDGDDVGSPAYENVTETIELLPYGSSTATLQAIVNGIERLIDYAQQRQKYRTGARVYLQLQVDGEASAYRSEILYGQFEPAEEALSIWGNYQFPARLHITRRYFWEGALTELQLSTSNSSAATGGKTIYNHDDSDAGNDNWVQIAAAQVGGAIPAPLRLTLQNNTGSAQGYRNIYMAVNAYSDPANFTHILEGESVVSGYGTATSLSTCSGGQYVLRALTAGTVQMHWNLSSTLLQDTLGRDFRILMRMTAAPSVAVYVTASVWDKDGLIPLAYGDEVCVTSSSNAIVDLGTLALPPGGYTTTYGGARLVLILRTAGSTNFNIDFFQLTPTDSFRRLYQRGYNAGANSYIIDDGIEGYTILQESSIDYAIYAVYDSPLTVFPNRTQKIIILHDEGSSSDIANTFAIRAYYRPRRLTV